VIYITISQNKVTKSVKDGMNFTKNKTMPNYSNSVSNKQEFNLNIENKNFKDVTLLITHYNRSSSLERLLKSFKKLKCFFEDIIVSDDGSNEEHLIKIKSLQEILPFRLITAPVNKGLGNNINKGQDAVVTKYTLYVQEDFEPAEDFAEHFKDGLDIFYERNDLDMIRFYAYHDYPYLTPIRNGYSEMSFKIWYPGYKKFYYYSDHPHLRYSNFFQKFGMYKEGVNVDVAEYQMMMSFLQKKGKSIFYTDYKKLFYQKNSIEEPSTFKRNFLRESNNLIITGIREIYRHLKFNYNFLFNAY
jgi:glycosyltransferase involved in cell wall biosynthesis